MIADQEKEVNYMTKIGVMIVLSVLLIGCAIYFLGTKVNPQVVAKSDSISTSVGTTTVNALTGAVTATAP
jgi:low temperature requirement protein LtrA